MKPSDKKAPRLRMDHREAEHVLEWIVVAVIVEQRVPLQ